MGYLSALGSIETLQDLRSAISLHFSSNCYPPVPQFMVPVAIEAINFVLADEWNAEVTMPSGVSYRGRESVSAKDVVESLYLQAFVDYLYNLPDEGIDEEESK